MPSFTRKQRKEALAHVLDEVLDDKEEDGSAGIIERVLANNKIFRIDEVLDLSNSDIDQLGITTVLKKKDGTEVPSVELLPTHKKNKLRIIKGYVEYQSYIGEPILTRQDWMDITYEDINAFRTSPTWMGMTTKGPGLLASLPTPASTSSKTRHDPVHEFRKGIKRDITQFSLLKSDQHWDAWNRTMGAQARAQDLSEVLNPMYTPRPTDLTAVELFDEKQKYMYAVFERTLQTDKGKALVRMYQDTYDAQTIYKELKEYSMKSTKASLDSRDLLSYISSSQLGDGKWSGTAHSYILHWQDQVRKYEELVSTKDHLSDSLKRIMLENAVYKVPELRSVKIAADQHKAQSGTELTYEQYSGLLCSAAQQHDAQFGVARKHSKARYRQVYVGETIEETEEPQEYVCGFDIDTDVNKITMQVYKTVHDDPGTRIPQEVWSRLSSSDKNLWRQFPQDTKRIILGTKTPGTEMMTNTHAIIDQREEDDVGHDEDVAMREVDGEMALEKVQVMASEVGKSDKKKLPPGDLRRLLGSKHHGTKTKQVYKTLQVQEDGLVDVNGEVYKLMTARTMYRTSSASRDTHGTLVDRGANGGIVGQDMRVIEKETRTVNVQGIDNHQINNIPLVTAGGVVQMQKGEAIAVVHQYAYTGKGKSIHSSGQLEWFKQKVDDRSRKVGGQQAITTVDGYIMPLQIRDGLPYLAMRPYTDNEWSSLPHVILTSDNVWDPSVLDDDGNQDPYPDDAILDNPIDLTHGLFDEYGDYRHPHEVQEHQFVPYLEHAVIPIYHVYLRSHVGVKARGGPISVTLRDLDPEQLRPYFAWLPVDVIRHTLQQSTQLAKMPMGQYLRTRYKSPNPAMNIHRRAEPIATDTVFADTPALDGGATCAQFYVSTKTLVIDIFGMRTESQFVAT